MKENQLFLPPYLIKFYLRQCTKESIKPSFSIMPHFLLELFLFGCLCETQAQQIHLQFPLPPSTDPPHWSTVHCYIHKVILS